MIYKVGALFSVARLLFSPIHFILTIMFSRVLSVAFFAF
jgi:hypothetical protein